MAPAAQPPTPDPKACGCCPACRARLDALEADRHALLDELAAIRREGRERGRWSAFGSAAGTAVVVTLWHLFSCLFPVGSVRQP